MTDKNKIINALNFWQKQLGLSSYVIRIKFKTPAEMKEVWKDAIIVFGYIENDALHKVATIYLNNTLNQNQMEITLIHELLHILLHPMEFLFQTITEKMSSPQVSELLGSVYEEVSETAINQISKALYFIAMLDKVKE